MDIVKLAIRNSRLTLSVLLFLIIAGALAYRAVPKEAEPDVAIPIMYVSLIYQGISPEDSERLLLRPVEAQLKNLKGLKEMRSAAYEGGGYVLVEFDPSTDLGDALIDTRNKVQDAKRDLPQGVEEPTVNEVNLSEFPVLVVTLSGDVPERVLTAAAKELRDRIEEVPGVLEGTLQGSRDELVEAIIDPMRLSSYGLRLDQLIQGIGQSNNLVAAGAMEGSEGKYAIKVPALIETPEDVARLPVVAGPNAVVRVQDIATVRSTFEDAETITRLDGKNAIAIEVKKRIGANIVETIDGAKKVADEFVKTAPEGMVVTYTQDKSVFVNQLLSDLQNHVLIAVILCFAADRHCHSRLLPDGHIGAGADGIYDQHDRAFQPDPRGRDAGGRCDHRDGVRRAAHVGRHAARAGIRACGQTHGGAGDRGDHDPHRGLFATAVLAGHHRRFHEIPADHANRHAGGIYGLCADLRTDAWRAVCQSTGA
jgi:multidrug efflux pump